MAEWQQAVHNAEFHLPFTQCTQEVVDSFDSLRSDRFARNPHPTVFDVLERVGRKLVPVESLIMDSAEPLPLNVGNHRTVALSPPELFVFVGGCGRLPHEDSWAVTREEVRRLVLLIGGPHERSIQPLLTTIARRRNVHRSGNELLYGAELAEVEQTWIEHTQVVSETVVCIRSALNQDAGLDR